MQELLLLKGGRTSERSEQSPALGLLASAQLLGAVDGNESREYMHSPDFCIHFFVSGLQAIAIEFHVKNYQIFFTCCGLKFAHWLLVSLGTRIAKKQILFYKHFVLEYMYFQFL